MTTTTTTTTRMEHVLLCNGCPFEEQCGATCLRWNRMPTLLTAIDLRY